MKEKPKTIQGNQDAREKSRDLSPAEERRLRAFEEQAARMIGQGYRRVDLTVSIVKANVFAVLLLIPLLIAGIGLFLLKNRRFGWNGGAMSVLLFSIALFVLIVVHELIHGASWALFAEHRWRDIEFGFMKQYLTPVLMGIIMADAAAGDILIVWKILRYKSEAGSIVYMDHPTQAGGVIFEK